MITYPFLTNFSKLSLMFSKLKESAVPTKFTFRYWALLGFTSSQDRAFIDLLKFLGYLDSNGYPTQYYNSLRDSSAFAHTLAERIRVSYSSLFDLDINANNSAHSELTAYFVRLTSVDKTIAQKQALTFKELCDKAQFNLAQSAKDTFVESIKNTNSSTSKNSAKLVFNINLPESTNPDVYKAIFEHLKTLLD